MTGRGDAEMQSMTANPMYALQNVQGKGQGLIAMENIAKGTRILSEEPIITALAGESDSQKLMSIYQQFDTLSEHQRRAFLSLYNIHGDMDDPGRYLGIFLMNCLPCGAHKRKGIFLEACRINHDCDNNAQEAWNENIKRHTVHALRDIREGEEITIYYLGFHKNHKARNRALQAEFGFTCSCGLCSLPPEQGQKSDGRLDEINHLDDLIRRDSKENMLLSPLQSFRYVDQLVRLYSKQGLDNAGLPRAFLEAARIAIANSDLARGYILAERAVSGWRTILGDDSMEVIEHEHMLRNLSQHELYGCSENWRTAVHEAPSVLDPGFEDWLWKRGQPGQLANLRSHATFPRFTDLPYENRLELDFYESNYQPRRHWCFLGEIVNVTTHLGLRMDIRDIDGTEAPLIYTDGPGGGTAPAQVQRGYTVAILYAHRHMFKHGETGILCNSPGFIKVPQKPPMLNTSTCFILANKMRRHADLSTATARVAGIERRGPTFLSCA